MCSSDFTFVCPVSLFVFCLHFEFPVVCALLFSRQTEIIQFSEKAPEFDKINCKVLGASVDSKFTHLVCLPSFRLSDHF